MLELTGKTITWPVDDPIRAKEKFLMDLKIWVIWRG